MKSLSLRLVAVVWLMAALSLVGWLIVNLDMAGWILVSITTGLMTFELTRKPVHRGERASQKQAARAPSAPTSTSDVATVAGGRSSRPPP